MYTCADCAGKPCRNHDLEQLPGNCPTADHSEEEDLALYSECGQEEEK